MGFTLIELMLVVAIIGLLAAIAIPKFADLVLKAREAAVKGKLGALRSALHIYYADNESHLMNTWSSAELTPKYLDKVPAIGIPTQPDHTESNLCFPNGAPTDFIFVAMHQVWWWDYTNGHLGVNCTHTDSTGRTWSHLL
jgi:prepilin-type N-terminal cleavage/methylation domain-containing protein